MDRIELLLTKDQLAVDIDKKFVIDLASSLKVLGEYGSRSTTFSKTIKVIRNTRSYKVFNNLNDILSVDAIDMGVPQRAILKFNGMIIVNGFFKITNVELDEEYYEIVVFTANINLFSVLADNLITGNIGGVGDIVFSDDDLDSHEPTREYIRNSWQSYTDRQPIVYPVINHDNNLTDFLNSPYYVYPALNALRLFDNIVKSNGFDYILSADMEQYMEQMYIPYNGNKLDISNDIVLINSNYYRVGKSLIDLNDGKSMISRDFEDDNSYYVLAFPQLFPPRENNYVEGTYEGGVSADGTVVNITKFTTKHTGDLHLHWDLYNGSRNNANDISLDKNKIGIIIVTPFNDVIKQTIEVPFDDKDINGNFIYTEQNLDIKISNIPANSELYFTMSYGDTSGNAIDYQLISSPDNRLQISFSDWVYSADIDNVYTRTSNNILPRNYKQADFILDIFNIFNAFVEIDKIDQTKLIINSYNSFYDINNRITKSFLNNVTTKNINFRSLANETPKIINFNFDEDGDDIYSKDYSEQFDESFGYNSVTNSSQIPSSINDIDFNFATTLMRNESINSTGLLETPVITNSETISTNFKPRLLFINTNQADTEQLLQWGGDDGTTLTKIQSLSNQFETVTDSEKFVLTTENRFRYYDDQGDVSGQVSNVTIYNKYYKNDIERRFNKESRIGNIQFHFTSFEYSELRFNDRIFLENHGYFRIEEIKSYKLNTEIAELVLVKEIDETYITYDDRINVKLLSVLPKTQDILDTFSSVGGGTSISGSGSGGITQAFADDRYAYKNGEADQDFVVDNLAATTSITVAGNDLYHTGNMNLSTVDFTANNIDIFGDLTIRGEIQTLIGTEVPIDDAWIKLNSGNSEVDSGIRVDIDGAGSLVSRFYRNAATDRWTADDSVQADDFFIGTTSIDDIFLNEANNLSDLTDVPTAQINLDIYSRGVSDDRFLNEANNLLDLDNVVAARINLDVYSKLQADTIFVNIDGDEVINDKKTFTSSLHIQENLTTDIFTGTNFAAEGAQLDVTVNNQTTLTVDNLNVRGNMRVNELEVKKITNIGGSLMVTNGNRTDSYEIKTDVNWIFAGGVWQNSTIRIWTFLDIWE